MYIYPQACLNRVESVFCSLLEEFSINISRVRVALRITTKGYSKDPRSKVVSGMLQALKVITALNKNQKRQFTPSLKTLCKETPSCAIKAKQSKSPKLTIQKQI